MDHNFIVDRYDGKDIPWSQPELNVRGRDGDDIGADLDPDMPAGSIMRGKSVF